MRKLAATIFADIQGYTAMMEADEACALALQAIFRTHLESVVRRFDGEIIQFYGDGCLMLFSSVSAAVSCARDAQRHFLEKDVPVRMGVHMGEVLHQEGNIFGDSVNLTSRIESIAVPGSVFLSGTVVEYLRNKSEFVAKSLGPHTFKNVAQPVQVYALDAPGLVVPDMIREKGVRSSEKRKIWWLVIPVVVVLGIVVALLFTRNSSAQADSDKADLAVMPFHVNGSADQQYLGQGLAQLISAKLEGVGNFRVIDQNALYGLLGEEHIIRDPKEAATFLKQLPAQKFIMGTVVALAEELNVTATLYDQKGNRLAQENIAAREDDLSAVIDQVTQRLIVANLNIRGEDVLKTGALTTGDLGALRSFFEGEKHRRSYEFHEAIEKYRDAIRRDSAFALALYRELYVTSMTLGEKITYDRVLKLQNLKSALPLKYQMLTDAFLFHLSRNVPAALNAYQQILLRYPDDVEANLMMAETIFHFGKLIGMPFTDARPYFEQVVKYDSAHVEAYSHLIKIDVVMHDSLGYKKSVQQTPENIRPLLMLDAYIVKEDTSGTGSRIAQTVRDMPSAPAALLATCWIDDYLPETLDLIDRMKQFEEPVQAQILELLQHMAKGQEEKVLAMVGPVAGAMGPVVLANLIAHPDIPAYTNHLDEIVKGLTENHEILEALPFASKWNYYETRCLLALASHNEIVFNQNKDSILQQARRDPDFRDYGAFMLDLFEGIRAFERGAYDVSEAHFVKLDAYNMPFSDNQSRSYQRPLARFMRGDICMRTGREEEALKWFENFWMEPVTLPLVPWTYQRRAQIYEHLGRTAEAIKFYGKFIELYQESDPAYASFVSAAKERRDALIAQSN